MSRMAEIEAEIREEGFDPTESGALMKWQVRQAVRASKPYALAGLLFERSRGIRGSRDKGYTARALAYLLGDTFGQFGWRTGWDEGDDAAGTPEALVRLERDGQTPVIILLRPEANEVAYEDIWAGPTVFEATPDVDAPLPLELFVEIALALMDDLEATLHERDKEIEESKATAAQEAPQEEVTAEDVLAYMLLAAIYRRESVLAWLKEGTE